MNNIKILGTGSCLPKKIIDNNYFIDTVNKNDEWIYSKTGIRTRHIICDNKEYINLMINASEEAITKSNVNKNDIDLLILATSTPTSMFGGASKIAAELKIQNAVVFDITLACNGFIIALLTVCQYIMNGTCKNALIIGADCLSRWVDWSDYKTSILFGDGVGAVVIGKNENINYGVIGHLIRQDNNKNNLLAINANEKESQVNNIKVINNCYDLMCMNGREVFNFVVDNIPDLINDVLKKSDMFIDDIKYIIPHQANQKILDKIAEKLNIDRKKILSNIEKYGNTSSASIPILLNETIEKNMIKKDDYILLLGFGAGMSCGVIIMKWN